MSKKVILEFVLKNWKALLIVALLIVVAMKSRSDYKLMQKHTKLKLSHIKHK